MVNADHSFILILTDTKLVVKSLGLIIAIYFAHSHYLTAAHAFRATLRYATTTRGSPTSLTASLTENLELDINEFILNRPSRVYYHFRYHKLDEGSIIDYCEDFNVEKETIEDIIGLSCRAKVFSFDMLQSIVEEHLRFDINVDEIIKDLNIDLREAGTQRLEILQVIEIGTNKERALLYSPTIIPKPVGYDYNYIKLKPGEHNNLTAVRPTTKALSENDEIEADNCEEFRITIDDLMFEAHGKEIYKTKEFTVVTRIHHTLVDDYSAYFANYK